MVCLSTNSEDREKSQQLQGAVYEEPLESAIPLRDNLAYGHVHLKRKS